MEQYLIDDSYMNKGNNFFYTIETKRIYGYKEIVILDKKFEQM